VSNNILCGSSQTNTSGYLAHANFLCQEDSRIERQDGAVSNGDPGQLRQAEKLEQGEAIRGEDIRQWDSVHV
jgi:hypothetical protein